MNFLIAVLCFILFVHTKDAHCSFLEKFDTLNNRWVAADQYANGPSFDCWWSKDNALIDVGTETLRLTVDKIPGFGKPYAGGELQSREVFGYGCYEVRMKPVNQEGLISSFFLYSQSLNVPGFNEVDVEFVYDRNTRTQKLQTNYYERGNQQSYKIVELGFDPSAGFHNYGLRWSEGKLEWFVDGTSVHSVSENIPKESDGRLHILMNLWPARQPAAGWAGDFTYQGPRTALYEGVRFTQGQNCVILNNFD